MTVRTTKPALNLREKLIELSAQPEANVLWEDLVAPVSNAKLPASTPPSEADFGTGAWRKEYAFAVNDYVWIQAFHIKHDISSGALAYPHVHWSTSSTNVEPVKWELSVYRALGHGQEAFALTDTINIEGTPTGTAWTHMVSEASDADVLVLTEPDEYIYITLKRVTNGGTDNTDNVFGLGVDLHYQVTRNGTKNKSPNFYT